MKDRMAVNTFAKKLGFKNGNAYGFKGHLRILERTGAIKVKQSGYQADSLHHPKVVIIKNLDAVEQHFKLAGVLQKKALAWKRVRKCHHRNFSIVATVGELQIDGKTIRRVILKCGYCEFYLSGIEIDGIMKEARLEVTSFHSLA